MDTTYTNPNANFFERGQGGNPITSISADMLNPATPINLSPTPQDTTNYSATMQGIPDYTEILKAMQTPTLQEQEVSKNKGFISDLLGRITGKGGSVGANGQIDTEIAKNRAIEESMKKFGFVDSADAFKQLDEFNNELNSLKKETLAIPIQIQEEFKGRGATASGVAPIEASRQRQNTLRSFQVASMTEALLGKISRASDYAEKAVNMEFAPLQAELNTLRFNYEMNKDELERADKKKAQQLEFVLNERTRLLEENKAERKGIIDIASQLGQYGVDQKTINSVLGAKSMSQALSLAGSKLQSPEAIAKLESIKLDQILTKQRIRKEAYELEVLKKYDGLSPAEYRKMLKEEQKTIQDTKDIKEKNRLQGQALNEKVILLDSVLKNKAIDSVVGSTFISRTPSKSTGESIGRYLLSGFLLGSKDAFTGDADRLIGQTEQFISKEFLQTLIDTKAQGGTFGALTQKEQEALTASATYIGQRRIYEGKGEDKEVIGYDMSESDFRKELQNIQNLTKKAYERAIGKTFDTEEQNVLDQSFQGQFNPSNYYTK